LTNKINKMIKVEIKWKDVAYFRKCGHGVEIYYNANERTNRKNLVAFVVGFRWWHGDSNRAEVRLLRRDSSKFTDLNANGDEVRDEVKRVVEKYVPERKPFTHQDMIPFDKLENKSKICDPITKYLTMWING